ncbi:MAG: endonuclease MutS2 [Armatimonadota bacterium]|nr:endonuclease MutS2 [Armatimonadota bacterium]MDW8144005.1 endonuclease MutS2 [Armatimonadota bacterium]
MDERTLRVLELDKILRALEERCVTELAKELARSLFPSVDIEEVRRRQRETSDARFRLERFGSPPLGGISDIRPILERAQQGSALEPQELLTVARTLERATDLKLWMLKSDLNDSLRLHAERICDHAKLIARIRWCIGDDGQVLDRASDELSSLRRRIKTVQQRMQQKLHDLLRDPSVTKFLQEPYYTIRDGRYCLPVRAEFRQQVPGIVHDKSSSGMTLFVEPEPLVEMGNELRLLQADEAREVARILRDLTTEVVSELSSIAQTLDAVRRLDFAFAKAKLSQDLRAYEPELNTDGIIKFRRARHPLLHFQGFVVPIDFELGERFDVLIITGPNTGGKTVTLKTVGLLTLMAQCGLHVPAAEGAKICLFRQVFADIGDEQSIEQSLSTFSSHMSHIAKMLVRADETTLVLLDELGAGTDPTEGAALAKAILLFLHRRGAKVVCTTHHSELKHFAFRQQRFENASVLFDPETLRPTYQLVIGIPGQSHAIDIARRLGVPTEVTREARRQLPRDRRETEELITQLTEERQTAERMRIEWERRLKELERREAELKEREQKLREEEQRILAEARRQAEALVKRVEGQAEELLKLLRKQVAVPQAVLPAEIRQRIRQLWQQLPPTHPAQDLSAQPAANINLSVGAAVRIRDIGVVGKITAVDSDGKEVQVDVGGMKVWVSATKLEPVGEATQVTPMQSEIAAVRVKKMISAPTELNLRGKRVDEAIEAVEKFLDDALLAGHKVVRIVHGKGTGKLRQAVHDYLRTHPQVRAFELAPLNEGGDGVTIAYLEAI